MRSSPIADLLGSLNSVEQKFAPAELYWMGHADLLRLAPRVAIVGSRRASPEGLARARRLAREVVDAGGIVVSGLAEGIDTAAHLAAIEAGGRTIAVIGTALDKTYPPENRELQIRIGQEHLLLSQFAPGRPNRPGNFPQRNRTMALISDATVIVEAGDSSGSLSQGWEALRLGRPLFFMRSVLEGPPLQWPAEMLNFGASVLTTTERLLDAVPPSGPSPRFELAL